MRLRYPLARLGSRILDAIFLLSTAATASHATTATESTLATFTSQPSQLIQAHDGNFYGTAPTGGTSGQGFVFQMTPGGSIKLIYSFTNGTDGGAPQTGLIEGNDGNLYGANTTGGNGSGVIFRLTLSGAITPLYSFNAATDGSNAGALIEDNAGNFFGAATDGGTGSSGTVFEYDHLGNFLLVHTFSGTAGDGALPNNQLLMASDGLVYGVTRRGGSLSDGGSIFRFDPASFASFTTIGSFPPTNLSDPFYNPSFGLTEGTDGALYGLTAEGGATGYGSIFKVVPGATPLVTLDIYDFSSFSDGGLPYSGFFLGGDGNLYATNSSYGPGNSSGQPNGTFFAYLPAGGTLDVLYAFGFPIGNSNGTPLEGADGKFYGPIAINQAYLITLTPPIPAPVSVTASAAVITLGQSVTIGWQVTNAFSLTAKNCYAHGAWSGSKSLTGSVLMTPAATGAFTYALTCGGVESASATVTVKPVAVPQTDTPVIQPASGTYTSPVEYDIFDATPGAIIHYTTNGTTPTTASPIWNHIPEVLVASAQIRAMAVASPLSPSNVAVANYNIQINRADNCVIEYPEGFHANADLVLNHGAMLAGGALELTHGLLNENTSAFAIPRIPLHVFETGFRFRFLGATPSSADGFTFTLQADGPNVVGTDGGGLGYRTIPHSMAIKFDLHNDLGEGPNSVGLYFNGAYPALPSIDLTPSGINLHSGHIMRALITYEPHFVTLNLIDTVTSKTFTHTFNLPAVSPIGSSTAYASFTAGTGGATSTTQILNWTLISADPCGPK